MVSIFSQTVARTSNLAIKPSTVTIMIPEICLQKKSEGENEKYSMLVYQNMFFHFKGYNLEFICYFIVCNVILTECHSHTHQLIIPLKCPNLLLDTFTE